MRIPLSLGGVAFLAACSAGSTGSDTAPRTETVQPIEQSAPSPAPAPAAMPSPAPAPKPAAPAGPTTFLFQGELTQGGWMRGQAPGGTRTAMLGETELVLDSDGRFFAAFDRDAPGTVDLVATLDDGRRIVSPVNVSPRAWNIENINAARRTGGSSEAFMRRRQPELDAIWNARLKETGATGFTQDFIWPVTGRISGRFGSQRIYRGEPGSYHSGIDIAPGNGVPFVAPADGVVVLAVQGFSLEGNLLIIDHGSGLNSAFLHASKLAVTEGDRVTQGQYIGNIGSSGRATGPHLHWSLKWRNSRLDPLLFTGPMN